MEEVVYRARPGPDLGAALGVLARAGLHPRTVDDPDPDPALRRATGYTVRIRIAVPAEEAPRAREALAEWERSSAERTRVHVRGFQLVLLDAILVTAGLAAIFRLFVSSWAHIPWPILGMLFLVALVVSGRLRGRAREPE